MNRHKNVRAHARSQTQYNFDQLKVGGGDGVK